MKIEVYTSQSINYFNDIGKYSLASCLKNISNDIDIFITTEDYNNFPKLNKRFSIVDLYGLDNGFAEFENRWKGKTMAKVINFAKKGYTVLHACENSTADILIWIDADAYFKQPITEEFILKLLNNNLGAHLGVTHADSEFTVESGFFILNLKHPGLKTFAKHYRDYYDNDRCENMGRFYDSNVHGHVVKDCEKENITFTEMNLRQKGNTPISGSMVHNHVGHFKGKKAKAISGTIYTEEYYRDYLKELINV